MASLPAFTTATAPLRLGAASRPAVCRRRAAAAAPHRPAGVRMLGGAAPPPPSPPPADGDEAADAPAAAAADAAAGAPGAAPSAAAGAADAAADATAPADGDAAAVDSAAEDILSSPAFLKKKMEVRADCSPGRPHGAPPDPDAGPPVARGGGVPPPSPWSRFRRSMLTTFRVFLPFLPPPADDVASLVPGYQILTKELNETKTEKEALVATLGKEKDSYLRLAADFENVRRRSSTQLAAATTSATATVVKKLLPALDNFERAASAAKPATPAEEKLHTSYQAIQKQLLTALQELGVEPLDTIGAAFDPNQHDAINRMESTEYAEGVICAQLQRGYKGGAGVIRPAVVVVSVGPGPPVADGADEAAAADEPEALDVDATVATDAADAVAAPDAAKPTEA